MKLARPSRILLALATAAFVASCGTTKSERRYSKEQAATSLKRFETVGLELGEFSIDGERAAIDGDTIRVQGLNSSMRLLCIDTEETFKKKEERAAFAEGWESYLKKMKGRSTRPVKMATPLGEDAKHFAQAFFAGVDKVKLERDHPGEVRDYYGRYLAYVFVYRNEQWVNYNLEAVRAGMSPYFTKYGQSRRFHAQFVEAQAQARKAKIGIWDPNKQHYPDYDERLAWWDPRGETIDRFEREMAENDNYFALTRWDTLRRLEERVGKEVVLLGAVGDIRLGDKGPTVVKLSRSRNSDFDVVFFDKDVFLASGLQFAKGEYVRVKGTVQKYRNKYNGREKLQIVVNLPGQVLAPSEQLDRLLDTPEPAKGRVIEAQPENIEETKKRDGVAEPKAPEKTGSKLEADDADEPD